MNERKDEIPANYCPQIQCRWKNYNNYKLILLVWMMNESAIMFAPTEIAHNDFYIHAVHHALAVIFIGIPLVYSEICLAQYTNCNIISMWNFLPLFNNIGYGMFYLVILKTIYLMVLTTWYLVYTFNSATDPPPWFTCDDYNNTKCMVKRVNVSVFQHCLEAEILFNDDCGMKTASNCFFQKEIGNNNTLIQPHCYYSWKNIATSCVIGIFLFLLTLKKEKLIQFFNKLLVVYMCIVLFLLISVSLSTSGTWYGTKMKLNWNNYDFFNLLHSFIRGFLSVGTGYGIIVFLTRDISFRSPATMTAITTSLLSLVISLLLSLIAFGGIRTMSYFHGEEENIIELGNNSYFTVFACMSEILIYFDAMPIWGSFWFSTIFASLLANLWIFYLYLRELLLEINIARKYKNISCIVLISVVCLISWPFFCSDLTGVLTDAIEFIQIVNSFFLSIALYWIYGYNNHSIDITFMIGIKPSYFWKITWLLNPIVLITIMYFKFIDLDVLEFKDSFHLDFLYFDTDILLFYIIVGIYVFIIVAGIIIQIIAYYHSGEIRDILVPTEDWGPRDKILYKSRKMFVPEIMTRKFLYRQVRINGYYMKKNSVKTKMKSQEIPLEDIEWSAMTSN